MQLLEDVDEMKFEALVSLVAKRQRWQRSGRDRTVVYGPANTALVWVELHESGKLVATGLGTTHEDALSEALTVVGYKPAEQVSS